MTSLSTDMEITPKTALSEALFDKDTTGNDSLIVILLLVSFLLYYSLPNNYIIYK